MRAVVNTEKSTGVCAVVAELPYQVNPDRLVVSIREAVRDGKIRASPTCETRLRAVRPASGARTQADAVPRSCSTTCTSIPAQQTFSVTCSPG